MSGIQSGPPVLSAQELADHFSSGPRLLAVVGVTAAALFAGSAIAGVAYWLIGMIRAGRIG